MSKTVDPSVWFPDRGETVIDGVSRVFGTPFARFGSVREMVEWVAERDWYRSDYWTEATIRARWFDGSLYEWTVTVESVPSFSYAGRELPDDLGRAALQSAGKKEDSK